jgi:hypothetical protein
MESTDEGRGIRENREEGRRVNEWLTALMKR